MDMRIFLVSPCKCGHGECRHHIGVFRHKAMQEAERRNRTAANHTEATGCEETT